MLCQLNISLTKQMQEQIMVIIQFCTIDLLCINCIKTSNKTLFTEPVLSPSLYLSGVEFYTVCECKV